MILIDELREFCSSGDHKLNDGKTRAHLAEFCKSTFPGCTAEILAVLPGPGGPMASVRVTISVFS